MIILSKISCYVLEIYGIKLKSPANLKFTGQVNKTNKYIKVPKLTSIHICTL